MGFLSSMAGAATGNAVSPALPPAPSATGVFPFYTQHGTETIFKLTENRLSWTGDDFNIKDAHNNTVFQCRAKKLSLHNRKEFTDASGKPLFVLLKRLIALHATFDAVDPNDENVKLFSIKKHLSFGKANLSLTFNNRAGGGEQVEFKLKGDFFDRKAEITRDGVPVARISRSFANGREVFFDKQTYFLSVAPGVDAAILVALCVCLDETENEQNK